MPPDPPRNEAAHFAPLSLIFWVEPCLWNQKIGFHNEAVVLMRTYSISRMDGRVRGRKGYFHRVE